QLEGLIRLRLPKADRARAACREAQVVDLLAALSFEHNRRLEAQRAEDRRVEGERSLHVAAHDVDVAEAGEHQSSSDSTSSVDTTTTRSSLPSERTPSSSITVQNGHATASVPAPVSAASRTRSSLIGFPRSSIHMCAPPAPQQNVRLRFRPISTGVPTAATSSRGSSRTSLCLAR